MKKHYRHENDCLNCGTELQGKYCHVCGQENLEIKETFGHMMNHAISDYFHFDHQFFHTLKPLLFKPGYLTNEYMAGRRAQYLHPVKMYIFISLVYFLLVFQQKTNVVQINEPPGSLKELAIAAGQINKTPYLSAEGKKKAVNELYADAGFKIKNNQWVKDTSRAARQRVVQNKHLVNPTTSDTTFQAYLANQQKLPETKRDGWFKRYWNEKAFAINTHQINIIETIEDSIKHNFPKLMFLLLPLFALILMLTFYRNKKFYVEHLIYAFHLHCFIFLFLSIILLAGFVTPASWKIFDGLLVFAAAIVIIWYVYKSLRVVYHRSWWRTILKMVGMYIVYFFVFLICISLLVFVTIFTAA